MKKHWLRGVLLGVSLALLVAGGVALAASLSLTVDQECFECWPGNNEDPEYLVEVTIAGYSLEDNMRGNLKLDGEVLDSGSFPATVGPPCHMSMYVPCDSFQMHVWSDCYGATVTEGAFSNVSEQQNGTVAYGDFSMRLWNVDTEDSARVGWRFAEDCAVQEVEAFVPEPGSILLLGSGLMGLAGYATLRWRTRE